MSGIYCYTYIYRLEVAFYTLCGCNNSCLELVLYCNNYVDLSWHGLQGVNASGFIPVFCLSVHGLYYFSGRQDSTVACIIYFHSGDHDLAKGSISQQSEKKLKKKCKFDLAPSLAHSKMATRKKKF